MMKFYIKILLGILVYFLFVSALVSIKHSIILFLFFSLIGVIILIFWMLVPTKYFYYESWKCKDKKCK